MAQRDTGSEFRMPPTAGGDGATARAVVCDCARAALTAAARVRLRLVAARSRRTLSAPAQQRRAAFAMAGRRRFPTVLPWPTAVLRNTRPCRCGRSLSSAPLGATAAPLPRDLRAPMATEYLPTEVEAAWYDWWEERGLFKPESAGRGRPGPERRTFAMVLPPPNVTGALHIGHALTVSIQDVLARWRRMHGDAVIWIPGLDHAGIATQTVVEKKLSKERGLTRHDLGREAFVDEVWAWHGQYGRRIVEQLRVLGASLDWSREVFTMDSQRSEAVVEAFVRLHAQGLIYRGDRMVNWCPHLRTVLSDIEVDYETIDHPTKLALPGRAAGSEMIEFGVMHNFAYPLYDNAEGQHDEIVVGTTRLETMLGDAAVVVHPEDDRYARYIGRHVKHPIHGHRLPVIADSELVDMAMGSGAVKITPAHDPNDFACAERHQLPIVSMMDDQGCINAVGAADTEFFGVDRFVAREMLVEQLESMGLYRGRDPHPMRLARCSRSGDVIEQMVKPQWFVQLHSTGVASSTGGSSAAETTAAGRKIAHARDLGGLGMASMADQMVAEGQIEITPSWHQGEWHRWMEGTKRTGDWCVSRQLWWGHRIPAYRVVLAGGQASASADEHWVVAKDLGEAEEKATALYGPKLPAGSVGGEGGGWHALDQDEDVLDTWFSSALFPLTALGWPHWNAGHGTDMRKFYPLDVMETGSDILFFWVARMAMVCSTLEPGLYGQRQQGLQQELEQEDSDTEGRRNSLPAVPFDRVLLHPVVRDKDGRKMSKSLGNVVDPLHVIHGASLETMVGDLRGTSLPEKEIDRAAAALLKEHGEMGLGACGSDALRWALIGYMAQGRQINLDIGRVVIARQFCNKVWQATRFTLRHLDAQLTGQEPQLRSAERLLREMDLVELKMLPLGQRWLLSRLAYAAEACNDGLSLSQGNFQLAAAQGAAQHFFLNELCDEYIEMTKIAVADGRTSALVGNGAQASAMLYLGIDSALRMLHPFLPFITEELHQRLRFAATQIQSQREACVGDSDTLESTPESIMTAAFPCGRALSCLRDEAGAEQEMATLMAVTKAVRSLQMLQGKLLPKGSDGCCSYEVRIAEDDVWGTRLLTSYADYVSARCRLKTTSANGVEGTGLRVVVGDGQPESADADAGSQVGWLGVAVASLGQSGSIPHTLRVRLGVRLDEEVQQKVRQEVKRLTNKTKKITAKKDKLLKQMTTPRYQENTPSTVKARDEGTVAGLDAEIDSISDSLQHLSALGSSSSPGSCA